MLEKKGKTVSIGKSFITKQILSFLIIFVIVDF